MACNAAAVRNCERRGVGRWKWRPSEKNHLPFFFRNRLISAGVHYHLLNSIPLSSTGLDWADSSWKHWWGRTELLPDYIVLVCCWQVSGQERKGTGLDSHMLCLVFQYQTEAKDLILWLHCDMELLVRVKRKVLFSQAELWPKSTFIFKLFA